MHTWMLMTLCTVKLYQLPSHNLVFLQLYNLILSESLCVILNVLNLFHYTRSLLIAIGIEAFNKFSESEQGHGSKQDTGPSEAPVLEENYGSIEDQSDSVPHPSHSNIFQILAKVANVAFSSIRVRYHTMHCSCNLSLPFTN